MDLALSFWTLQIPDVLLDPSITRVSIDQLTFFSLEAMERGIKIKKDLANRETSGHLVAHPSLFLI